MLKKCEQTVDCWLKEVDGWLKEVDGWLKKVSRKKKSKCRKLAGRKNEKCESLFVCVCTTRTE